MASSMVQRGRDTETCCFMAAIAPGSRSLTEPCWPIGTNSFKKKGEMKEMKTTRPSLYSVRSYTRRWAEWSGSTQHARSRIPEGDKASLQPMGHVALPCLSHHVTVSKLWWVGSAVMNTLRPWRGDANTHDDPDSASLSPSHPCLRPIGSTASTRGLFPRLAI